MFPQRYTYDDPPFHIARLPRTSSPRLSFKSPLGCIISYATSVPGNSLRCPKTSPRRCLSSGNVQPNGVYADGTAEWNAFWDPDALATLHGAAAFFFAGMAQGDLNEMKYGPRHSCAPSGATLRRSSRSSSSRWTPQTRLPCVRSPVCEEQVEIPQIR